MQRYLSKISGPVDRIDIHMRLRFLSKKLSEDHKQSSVDIGRVTAAREIKRKGLCKWRTHYNAQMNTKHIRNTAPDDFETIVENSDGATESFC
jgi:predicted ATPase with chaperone activity